MSINNKKYNSNVASYLKTALWLTIALFVTKGRWYSVYARSKRKTGSKIFWSLDKTKNNEFKTSFLTSGAKNALAFVKRMLSKVILNLVLSKPGDTV